MMRLFFIAVFLFITGNLCGQVSHATISATIVTPVGAEISNDANFEKVSSKIKATPGFDNNFIPDKNAIPFLKIIGGTFSHHVTVENDYVPLNKGSQDTSRAQQHEFVSITVNFD